MKRIVALTVICILTFCITQAQDKKKLHEETEIYSPVPPKVIPGAAFRDAPSDAIILFNGKNMDQWMNTKDSTAASWILVDDAMTVNKTTGDIQTRALFRDFQLHAEYRIPSNITGKDQARGNSGIYLASLPWGIGGYEIQVLDNYDNTTYVNGQCGSIYKQAIPLVNACMKPGVWQSYDIIWTAPVFSESGLLKSLARVTVFHNGVLVQNNTTLLGDTPWEGQPAYRKHGAAPIRLQAHGDKSEPISYRNIWLRPL